MIKELLLSIAVAAASGVSSFVGSPKKSPMPSNYSYQGHYYFKLTVEDEQYTSYELQAPYTSGLTSDNFPTQDLQNGVELADGGDWQSPIGNAYRVTVESWDGGENYLVRFYWGSFTEAVVNEWNDNLGEWITNQTIDGTGSVDEILGEDDYAYVAYYLENGTSVSFELGTQSYSLQKNFLNCEIASSPVLPSTYTNELAPMKPTYYVLMVSHAGGYGFTSESVTQTGGITIRNFSLFDQYNNSGYYASCSFTAELPYNDCSITIQAFLPTYTITANLERCTVSPAIPSSYTGTSFSGDYTFTAVSGYGFNENYTHWEVSNLFVDSVEFSSLLWGSFYSSVTLHLRASGGNSSISVTAIKYDEESYKLGYEEGREDGWQAGYDRGHADGEIAGNSYGVWNWLKQAAITTGEFLSIPLLPGFSIGGLLTALAGLMIIWLFIKGFLFKS